MTSKTELWPVPWCPCSTFKKVNHCQTLTSDHLLLDSRHLICCRLKFASRCMVAKATCFTSFLAPILIASDPQCDFKPSDCSRDQLGLDVDVSAVDATAGGCKHHSRQHWVAQHCSSSTLHCLCDQTCHICPGSPGLVCWATKCCALPAKSYVRALLQQLLHSAGPTML